MEIIEQKEFIGKTFENIHTRERYQFENCIFKDTSFINVRTSGIVKNCTFINCKVIDCHFGTYCLHNNQFIDCHFDGLEFHNHGEIVNNQFIRVTGNIKEYDENQFSGNLFKDMDFSGFLPFYMWPPINSNSNGEMRLTTNYFINTRVGIEDLKRFSEGVDIIKSYPGGAPICFRDLIEGTFIRDMLATPPVEFDLDLRGMNEDAKLNVIASIFNKIHSAYTITGYDGPYKLLEGSHITYTTVPNPRPITIVDNRGYELNPDVIQDISFDCPLVMDEKRHRRYECKKLEGYTEENSLNNPDNYTCYSLVKK